MQGPFLGVAAALARAFGGTVTLHPDTAEARDVVAVFRQVPLLPVRPSAQGVVGFQAQAAAVQDSAGQQRRAALVMTWNGTVEDIIGIKFQIRIAGQTSIVSRAQSRDFEEGELLIESGLVAATAYECRAKYITGTARPVSWTAWVAASTQDIRLMSEDFASSIRPPEIVSALPSVGNYEGRLVVFTVDGKLYRFHDGIGVVSLEHLAQSAGRSVQMIFGLPKLYLYGAAAVAVLAFGLWLRRDAVRDYQAGLTVDRLEQIQDARTIEYETRSATDDALIDCLRGAGC